MGFGFEFDARLKFLWRSDGSWGKNVIALDADMSSFVHVDNKNENILVLREGPTEGLYGNTGTAEANYPINFTAPGKRFVLSLHYNGSNSFLFVNAVKMF